MAQGRVRRTWCGRCVAHTEFTVAYNEPSVSDRNDRRLKKRLALMNEERLCLNHEEELRHGIQSEGADELFIPVWPEDNECLIYP
jgi:hypothetical protein